MDPLPSSPLQPFLSISISPVPAISISHLDNLRDLPTTHLFSTSKQGNSVIPLTLPTEDPFSVLTSYLVFLYSTAQSGLEPRASDAKSSVHAVAAGSAAPGKRAELRRTDWVE